MKKLLFFAMAAIAISFTACQKDAKVAPAPVSTAVPDFDNEALSFDSDSAPASAAQFGDNSTTSTAPGIALKSISISKHGKKVTANVTWKGSNLLADGPNAGSGITFGYVTNNGKNVITFTPETNIGNTSFVWNSVVIAGALSTANDGQETFDISSLDPCLKGLFTGKFIIISTQKTNDPLGRPDKVQAYDEKSLLALIFQPKECQKMWN